jgi:hypothetical protein
MAYSAVSKFVTTLITDFNFVQTDFIKNIKKEFMTSNSKKPKYPVI